MKSEIYVSTDVETDGPCPGLNSMLSIGSAAFDASGKSRGFFSANLHQLPHPASMNPKTMEWWATQPGAWAAHRTHCQDPAALMPDYAVWLDNLPGKVVFVGFPAGFDFTFVYWYLHKFVGRSPFGFQALDMKTFGMATMRKRLGFKGSTKKNWPKSWFPVDQPHTHQALDDALEQGYIFLQMLKANDDLREKALRYEDLTD